MRILYVSQYFPPEMGAPAARVFELSREWVRRGHEVTVLTAFPHHPTGVKRAEDRGVLTRREEVEGIDVVRAYIYAAPNQGVVRRMLSYSSFLASASIVGALRVPTPEVVIGSSPQLFSAVAGYGLARHYGVPFVLEVRDLWPESILAVGALSGGPVIQGLKAVARHLYRRSEKIVTVGEGYSRMLQLLHGVPRSKILEVPNGVNLELFVPKAGDAELRKELGWGDRFVVLYLGTHGMAHGLGSVLDAAERLKSDDSVLFAFVGEGAEKQALKSRAAGWSNVQFIDQQSRERVPRFYAACDLGLVVLRKTPLFQEVLPSKIFEYLGMERPLIVGVEGEARRLVEEAGAGVFVPPEDPAALAEAVRGLKARRGELLEWGRRGREYVARRYDRARLADRYLEILGSL